MDKLIINNGDEMPIFLYEALDISRKRDEYIGKFVMRLEKEECFVADAIKKIMDSKRLSRKEKFYAVFKLGERKQSALNNEYLLTDEQQEEVNTIGRLCLGDIKEGVPRVVKDGE